MLPIVNARVRDFTLQAFRDMGFEGTDANTNCVFIDIKRPAKDFREACAAQKIRVGRDFPPYEKTHTRIALHPVRPASSVRAPAPVSATFPRRAPSPCQTRRERAPTARKGARVGKTADVLPGTVDMLILKAVALKPLHGYGVLLRLRQISGNAIDLPQGSLYPALYRLEHQGLIAAAWGQSENGRRAKFYTITASGRRRLKDETASWQRLAAAIASALAATADEV